MKLSAVLVLTVCAAISTSVIAEWTECPEQLPSIIGKLCALGFGEPCFYATHFNASTGQIHQATLESQAYVGRRCCENIDCDLRFIAFRLCCYGKHCLTQCYGDTPERRRKYLKVVHDRSMVVPQLLQETRQTFN